MRIEVKPLYYEDVNVGDIGISSGRTITETDIMLWVGIAGDFDLAFTDEEYAKKTPAGTRIAPGVLTITIAQGLFARTFNLGGSGLGMLGWEGVKFRGYVKPGDTLQEELEVIEKRDSKSIPNAGIIIFKLTLRNQRGETVLIIDKWIELIMRRPKE